MRARNWILLIKLNAGNDRTMNELVNKLNRPEISRIKKDKNLECIIKIEGNVGDTIHARLEDDSTVTQEDSFEKS